VNGNGFLASTLGTRCSSGGNYGEQDKSFQKEHTEARSKTGFDPVRPGRQVGIADIAEK
jgi:hypothetical protein